MRLNNKRFLIALLVAICSFPFVLAILNAFGMLNERMGFLVTTVYTGLGCIGAWWFNCLSLYRKEKMDHLLDGTLLLILFISLLWFTISTWTKLH